MSFLHKMKKDGNRAEHKEMKEKIDCIDGLVQIHEWRIEVLEKENNK